MAPSAPCRRGRRGAATTATPAQPPASPWWAAPRRRAEWRTGGERHRIVPGAVARGFAPRLRGRQARACALGSEPVPDGTGSLLSLSAEVPSISLDYLSRVDLGLIIAVW